MMNCKEENPNNQRLLRADNYLDRSLDRLREMRLPALVEEILSWTVATCMVAFYGYHHYTSRIHRLLPLVAESKSYYLDFRSVNVTQKEQKLRELHDSLMDCIAKEFNLHDDTAKAPLVLEDDKLVDLIRGNLTLRRQVSLWIQMEPHTYPLYHQLIGIYDKLLDLPKLKEVVCSDAASLQTVAPYPFEISLIIPAHNETKEQIVATIHRAWETCEDPARIEIVVVLTSSGNCNAQHSSEVQDYLHSYLLDCINIDTKDNRTVWSEIRVLTYSGGGGRGPTLNFGAEHCHGRIFTFLHADCLLPTLWDRKICHALSVEGAHACAFAFGVDTSPGGLQGERYPWGIEAVRWMVNIRTRFFRLPYGDQAISVPSVYFHYLGGFPNQPIMEDYDFMDYLRKRASVRTNEKLVILDGEACLCSVRRWQKVGVLYVTLSNALLVHRYTREGWTPRDIFEYYYQRPQRKHA